MFWRREYEIWKRVILSPIPLRVNILHLAIFNKGERMKKRRRMSMRRGKMCWKRKRWGKGVVGEFGWVRVGRGWSRVEWEEKGREDEGERREGDTREVD